MIVKKNINGNSKIEILQQIANIAKEEGLVKESRLYLKGLIERENKFSTYIGSGIAMPHCRCEVIREISIIICTLNNKVSWDCIEKCDVDFVIALAIPSKNIDNEYLQIISKLARNLMKEDFVKELKSLENEKQIIDKIKSTIN
ncbi:MAG: PTS sugar transporter subunit IIA [Peptostreptococcaceae bacterium]